MSKIPRFSIKPICIRLAYFIINNLEGIQNITSFKNCEMFFAICPAEPVHMCPRRQVEEYLQILTVSNSPSTWVPFLLMECYAAVKKMNRITHTKNRAGTGMEQQGSLRGSIFDFSGLCICMWCATMKLNYMVRDGLTASGVDTDVHFHNHSIN
jgi:hypothetical protein